MFIPGLRRRQMLGINIEKCISLELTTFQYNGHPGYNGKTRFGVIQP